MKLGFAYFSNGALCALLATAIAVACGSDSQHRNDRSSVGGAGGAAEGGTPVATIAGDGGAPAAGGAVTSPQPAAGNGGEAAAVEVGGNGGAPPVVIVNAGEGGLAVIGMGGTPSAGEAGAGGVPPDTLPAVNCDAIAIADAQLEAAVRAQLGKPTGVITAADAASLTALGSSQFSGITSVAGIECFTELTDLYLGVGGQPSNVQNLAPLRYLRKLARLDLNNNSLPSLEPLGELPQLQELNLKAAVNHISLAPLAAAPALTILQLNSCQLDDLTPLGAIPTLTTLELNNTTLSAAAALSLSKLKTVTELHLAYAINDATPVAALTQLKILDVSQKPLTNFDKLSTLVNLTQLDASYTQLTSITAIAGMTQLTDLNIAFDQVVDIAALQGLTQLKNFSANFNPITDVTPLVNNAGIATGDLLNLAGTSLSCATQGAKVATLIGRGVTVYSPCN